ncbi:dienelactone hydrolase family protein [Phenylobacterium sp.]|uniref:dienelactone hydrolase family protein n=1 Tax=Phenylobacterium sp. TaxID=1871053 RepID=UPI002DF41318|nr:dienelactone hydrolase family protein [Phenylobacterium sp.]
MRQDVTIPTPDGDMRAFVFTPDAGQGPWPAAIMFMDAPAIRPALFEMGERLAKAGYYVLLPDLFWRAGPYDPPDIKAARAGDPEAVALFQKLRGSTGAGRQMTDTKACLDFLDSQPRAAADKVGVTGYCMGGGIALRAAGTFPDRIAAAASFHGGNMATDDEKSPHRLAPAIKAKLLIAGADEDSGFPPEQCDRLAAALKAAGVDAEVSIWKGAKHGWVPTDMAVHNPQAAERHWRELIALFDGALKEKATA